MQNGISILNNIEMLRVEPNQDQFEISNTDKFGLSFALRGFKYVNGDLWLQLERDRPAFTVNNLADETNFDSSPHIGWIKAHADDGELAFRYINPCWSLPIRAKNYVAAVGQSPEFSMTFPIKLTLVNEQLFGQMLQVALDR